MRRILREEETACRQTEGPWRRRTRFRRKPAKPTTVWPSGPRRFRAEAAKLPGIEQWRPGVFL